MNPGFAGAAAYGFAGMGPYSGGQTEYLRVPFGDFNYLKLPEDARKKIIKFCYLIFFQMEIMLQNLSA